MAEVLIDMDNVNAIITVAMLAAIQENQGKDYLDIINPFVCNLLPAKGNVVDFLNIQQQMEDEYGFVKMPIGVIQKIVSRLCVGQTPLCVQQGYSKFSVCQAYDNTSFRSARSHTKEDCDAVAEAIRVYLYNERSINYDIEKCTTELLRFLDKCGHHVLKSNEPVRSLPIDEQIGRYIACFIQAEKEKKTSIYNKVLELARGYMVYRCIYFFCQNGLNCTHFSLKNVVIYLDTPLIIDLLGFDTDVGNRAIMDAVSLAQSLGARVTALDHNVDEAKGILYAYINAYPRIQTFILERLTLLLPRINKRQIKQHSEYAPRKRKRQLSADEAEAFSYENGYCVPAQPRNGA